MKIHRFTGSNTQKALAKIHQELGADALIYSTRSIENGVEILAAVPQSEADVAAEESFAFEDFGKMATVQSLPLPKEEPRVQVVSPEQEIIQRLNEQLSQMDEKVNQLSQRLQGYLTDGYAASPADNSKDNQVLFHLSKLGFRGQFCQDFIRQFTSHHALFDVNNEDTLHYSLQSYIKTTGYELIDTMGVYALIGPTGIGKTTTIAKIAKRFISKYGPHDLGLITTDYQDIASINQMIYHNNLLNVDLEYANSPQELAAALETMRNKKLVLIDTYGVSQRDQRNLDALRAFLGSQGDKIATYIALPCNVQEDILHDIAREFKTQNTRGCILTKEDECISVAPAISVCITQGLNIAYVCNGQNLSSDIRLAKSGDIMQKIVADANAKPAAPEKNTFKNTGILSTLFNEGSYARQSVR